MAIDRIFNDANVDGIADNIFGAVNNSVSEVKQMQQRKAAENVQLVVEAFKKIETNITEKFDNVTDVIEKRVLTIKDGRDGSSGSDGRNGRDGKPGRDGVNGKQGVPGTPGKDGVDGVDGVSVTDANIDFDGSLVISLSSGQQINVGEVVPPELERQLVELRQGGSAGSSGDVAGPTSSTDNAIVRFDGTTGKLVQNSVVTIADTTGNMAGVGTLGVGAITTTGALIGTATQNAFNTVSTTLNLGGAATAVNIGAATGTATVANATLAAKAITATSLVSSGTAASSFTVTSGTAVPLTITNVGTGNSFVVEDSASTDASPFVIDAAGKVAIGATTATENLNIVSDGRNFLQLTRASTDASQSVVSFRKARGTSAASTIVVSGDAIGDTQFYGYDGAAYILAASIVANVDGTPGTNDMPGRLVFNTTADGASSTTERMRINSAGSVGIGGSPAASVTLNLARNITGATTSSALQQVGEVQSDVTTLSNGYLSTLLTQAAAFTLGQQRHFSATQSTIGATSAVTNQYGFFADSTLTGATNNYGFFSNIASTANRYNFYANGTADNYFAGATTFNTTLKVTTGAAVGGATPGAGGLAFPATAVAVADANTLDDYEEGTFTPVVRDAAAGNAAAAATSIGRYTKIGNRVTYSIDLLNVTTAGLTAGNQVFVTGIPFTSNATANNLIPQNLIADSVAVTTGAVSGLIFVSSTAVQLYNNLTTGISNLLVSQLTSGSADLWLSGSYET